MGKNHEIHGNVEIFPQSTKGLLRFHKSNRRCGEKEAHYRLGWTVTWEPLDRMKGSAEKQAELVACWVYFAMSLRVNGEITFLLLFFHPNFLWISVFLSLCPYLCPSFSLEGKNEAYILSVWLKKLAEYMRTWEWTDLSRYEWENKGWLLTPKAFLFLTSSVKKFRSGFKFPKATRESSVKGLLSFHCKNNQQVKL